MKHLTKTLIAFCLFGFGTAKAQQVVTSAGDFHENAEGSISYTIGEPVTETITSTNAVLTQGFQQGNLKITVIQDITEPGFQITVFPNPATEFVIIQTETEHDLSMKCVLYDIKGDVLLQKQLEGNETSIPMESYTPSIYLLKIFVEKKNMTSQASQEIKTVKITKE